MGFIKDRRGRDINKKEFAFLINIVTDACNLTLGRLRQEDSSKSEVAWATEFKDLLLKLSPDVLNPMLWREKGNEHWVP